MLKTNADCRECLLGNQPDLLSPGLPSRSWDGFKGRRFDQAVFLVGAYPGRFEDMQGKAFAGAAGQQMNTTYVGGAALYEYADVYLGNALRCAPRDGDSVTDGCIKACRTHMLADLEELSKHYKKVTVVCCGEQAIKSVLGKGYSLGRFPQGRHVVIGRNSYTVFATSNPARLLRDPSILLSVMEHMLMVNRYVRLGRLHDSLELPRASQLCQQADPPPNVGIVSLDIETHGAAWGLPKQTGFHPMKSLVRDRCPRNLLIATVACSWRDPFTGQQCHKVWVLTDPGQRAAFITAMKRIKKLVILGQNLQFDILYLRAIDNVFRQVFSQENCFLMDLMTVSYLENDQRQERSLGSHVVVQGIDDYLMEPVDFQKGQRYRSVWDPRLWLYNVRDSRNTLLLYEMFTDNIIQSYGTDTDKWSEESREWYNQMNWLAITMSENGIKYDLELLQLRHAKLERKCEWLKTTAKEAWGLIIGGKGVQGSMMGLLQTCIDKYAPEDGEARESFFERLVITPKTQVVSLKDENIRLLMGVVPLDAPERDMLRVYSKYITWSKLVSSFTRPLLGLKEDPEERQAALVQGVAYPSWHVSPSQAHAFDKGQGGTKQVRFAARNPSLQNQPTKIERCQRSRWPGGARISADQSQVELRVPAALSGDPAMLSIFRAGISLHAKTGSMLAGFPITKKEHPLWYAGGKTFNFLRLFGGTAWKAQHTFMSDLGLFMELDRIEQFLQNDKREYPVMYAWQGGLIKEAQSRGRLDIPIIGASRTFLGRKVDEYYYNEILNIRVQGMAAAITQSAQWDAMQEFKRRKLKVLTVSNTHDEGIYDCPAPEVEEVCGILKECFRMPTIWKKWLDRGVIHEVPLDSEIVVSYNPTWRPQ